MLNSYIHSCLLFVFSIYLFTYLLMASLFSFSFFGLDEIKWNDLVFDQSSASFLGILTLLILYSLLLLVFVVRIQSSIFVSLIRRNFFLSFFLNRHSSSVYGFLFQDSFKNVSFSSFMEWSAQMFYFYIHSFENFCFIISFFLSFSSFQEFCMYIAESRLPYFMDICELSS